MKHRIFVLAALAALGAAAPAAASPDKTITPAAPEAKWTGPVANGLNTSWFLDGLATTGTCANTDEQSRCDSTKVFLSADRLASGAKLKVRMDGFKATDDFDLRVYDLGTRPTSAGTKVGEPIGDVAATSPLGTRDPRHTGPGDFETTEVPIPTIKGGRWYRIDIVYFSVVQGAYNGTVTATGLIDDPDPVVPSNEG
jgi:hypothetical protein